MATIVTPNLAEAGALLGKCSVNSLEKMEEAARKLQKMGPKAGEVLSQVLMGFENRDCLLLASY